MSEQQTREVRRRRSRTEVEQLVTEYEASGASQTEFCRTHGLALSTLHRYCKRRRQAADRERGVARWVAVEVPDQLRNGDDGSGLALLLASGRRIEIGRGFDPSTLEQLLRVLEPV
jgi:hypothetical protein